MSTELSEAEQKVIEQFGELEKEEQEELIVNLGTETVLRTIEILGLGDSQ